MLVENQTAQMTWTARNKTIYVEKGYEFTNIGDIFYVKVEDLSKGSRIKVQVKCDYCGEIIWTVWRDYLKCKNDKYACKHCRQKRTSENNLAERQDYLYNTALNFCNSKGYILITKKEDIINSNSIVEYMCPKHGINKTKVYALILQHGCPKCQYENNSIKLKNTIDDLLRLGSELSIVILNPEEYIDYYTSNLKCVCNKCGDVYITSYQLLKSGKCVLCKKCAKSESHGETKIRLYLESKLIEFEQQKRFSDCRTKLPLPFDFYLPNINTVIEYDGEGHFYKVDFKGHDGEETFQRTITNDKIKNKYCEAHNINLIRIPYWDFSNIEKILDDKLFISHKDIV